MSIATMMPRTTHRQTAMGLGSAPRLRSIRQRTQPWIGVAGIRRDLRVQFAATRQDWEEALQLVTDNYQARGFEEPGSRLRFTPFHALPDTVVLVAKEAGHVVATFTLVVDNPLLGLPLECLYREELRELRRQGHRLAETGSLAERGLTPREFLQVFVTQMQLGWQHMLRSGIDTSVIAVNPRHSGFYSKAHGFAPLGPRRSYDKVQGAPAEAFFLTPELMQQRVPHMHQRIFGCRLPAAALTAPPMPADLIRHFAQRSSQTDLRSVDQMLAQVELRGSFRRN